MSMDHQKSAALAPTTAKIIPLRRDGWLVVEQAVRASSPAERGRHFLKVTLPAIPVVVFLLTFLLCYAMEASDASRVGRAINPLPTLLGALALAGILLGVCALIYHGYRQVTDLVNTR